MELMVLLLQLLLKRLGIDEGEALVPEKINDNDRKI